LTSCPKFVRHLEGLAVNGSTASVFERAADAIVTGDLVALDTLLGGPPDLARARSDREHNATQPQNAGTALHIAAYRGNVALTTLLLRRGAPVNVIDGVYKSAPIVWALHGWLVENREPADAYKAIVRMLVDAGAEVKPQWIADDRVRADVELNALLQRRAGE
jgi:hypothetical protein